MKDEGRCVIITNLDEFILLLHRARGDYTVNQFASICGVAPSYLSRIINKKNKCNVSIAILLRIADKSEDKAVTFEVLLYTFYDIKGKDEFNSKIHDELLDWANNPKNRELLEFVYNSNMCKLSTDLLRKSKLVIDI